MRVSFLDAGTVRMVDIVREAVRFPTVLADTLGGVGYVGVLSFTESTLPGKSTYTEFVSALEATRGFPVTVLDLRGNGGGSLGIAVQMCQELLAQGVMFRQLERRPDENGAPLRSLRRFNAYRNGKNEGRRFVLLADSTSASASEVFLAALREGLNAPQVGTRTYGKAVGQVVLETPDGGYAVITQILHTTASGVEYDGQGLVPSHPSGAQSDAMLAEAALLASGGLAKSAAGSRLRSRASAIDWNRRQMLRPAGPGL
jgi:carboxyl-terminal processing protease